MEKQAQYLLELLKCAVLETAPCEPDDDIDFKKLFSLAFSHSVANTAYYSIVKLPEDKRPEKSVMDNFEEAFNYALIKESKLSRETNKILSAFEKADIGVIALKGTELKKIYPTPDMRLMFDADILYEPDKRKKACELMESLGFETVQLGDHHDIFRKSSMVTIELHRYLTLTISEHYDYFSTIWDRLKLKEGHTKIYQMSNEDFYIFMIEHMAKHYSYGGTGIRSVMDIWVYNMHFASALDREYINNELDKLGLLTFAKHIERLSKIWFEGEESDEFSDSVGEYIIESETYGKKENSLAIKINDKQKDTGPLWLSKLKYLISYLFPNKDMMSTRFPILKKAPILLPFTWIIRIIKNIFVKPKELIKNSHNVITAKQEDVDRIKNLHDRLGL